MRVVVLIPRRADHGRRDQIWGWVKNRWSEEVDWPVYEGHDDGPGKFNRSLAINRAAEKAGDWDVAVIADSDTFCGTKQLVEAVEGATGDCGFWLAYDIYAYLTRQMSDKIMKGFVGNWHDGVEFTMTGTCSSMVVVERSVWDEVGGFDPGFVGWGFEDVAFSHACQTMGNGLRRTHGHVWHLHHPSSPENSHRSPEWKANRARMMQYQEAAYDEPRMRKLLAER